MLNNKVVLVTGASSGIGLAIALMAVREGARLVQRRWWPTIRWMRGHTSSTPT